MKRKSEASLEISWECVARPGRQCQFQNHAVLCGFATVMHILYLSEKSIIIRIVLYISCPACNIVFSYVEKS